MEGPRRVGKHHNLRHVLPPAQQAAALQKVGGGPAATQGQAGERILSAKQKELQSLFELVYGVPTSSFNNEWLRRKLLTAVGLPANWRPPPELAPELPPCRPEECSRYGRRRRRVASYAVPDSSSEDEGSGREESPAPRAIRRRASNASLASAGASRREGSADSATAGPRPALVLAAAPLAEAPAHGWASDGACSGASSGASTPSAILAMQARAAAAFAGQPAAPAAPAVMVPVQPLPQQPLHSVPLPSAGQPAAPAQRAASSPAAPPAQPSSLGLGLGLSLGPSQAPAPSLAAFLSQPQPAPAPLAEQLLPPPGLAAFDSLSAQLHTLYADWEAGTLSLNLGAPPPSFGAL